MSRCREASFYALTSQFGNVLLKILGIFCLSENAESSLSRSFSLSVNNFVDLGGFTITYCSFSS